MDASVTTRMLREGIWVVLRVGGPMLLLSLTVGVLVAIFQATTQIHEQTLGFILKLSVVILFFLVAGGWAGETLLEYARSVFEMMAATR